jgi:hypothetical protein
MDKLKHREAQRRYRQAHPGKARAAYAKWHAANPDKARAAARVRVLQNTYGLTEDAYYALLAHQDLKCRICGGWLDLHKNTHIDHSHITGRVRGVLCGPCNKGLGQFRDSAAILRAAAAYLDEAA